MVCPQACQPVCPLYPPNLLWEKQGSGEGSVSACLCRKLLVGGLWFWGWPDWRMTHFGSSEMSFHLRRLQQHGGKWPFSQRACGLVAGAAVVFVAGLPCS